MISFKEYYNFKQNLDEAMKLVGTKRFNEMVAEFKEAYRGNPYIEMVWEIPRGQINISSN